MMTTTKLSALALVLGVMGSGACSFDIANPNTPDVIGENPNRSQVAATANGILVATRADMGDWALDGGIFGREAYRFDGSDPRFAGELMGFLAGPAIGSVLLLVLGPAVGIFANVLMLSDGSAPQRCCTRPRTMLLRGRLFMAWKINRAHPRGTG